jgi:hypothetical protein
MIGRRGFIGMLLAGPAMALAATKAPPPLDYARASRLAAEARQIMGVDYALKFQRSVSVISVHRYGRCIYATYEGLRNGDGFVIKEHEDRLHRYLEEATRVARHD